MPRAAPSRLPNRPWRVFAGESDGASGTVPKRLPTMNAPTSAPAQPRQTAATRTTPAAPRSAASATPCASMTLRTMRPTAAMPKSRIARVVSGRTTGKRAPGEHEPTDEQVGGLGATQRDRDHDRQARDLEGDEVVARQVGEPAPLDQGDRGDRGQQDRQRGQAAEHGHRQDAGQDRVAHRAGTDDARVDARRHDAEAAARPARPPMSPIPAMAMSVAAASWVGVTAAPGSR